jgi:CheY-like chemotaxis protein
MPYPEVAMSERSERVAALVKDLIFVSRIEATLGGAGYSVDFVEDVAGLRQALAKAPPVAVLLDLHAGNDAAEVVAACQGAPVVAFGRHTEPALLRAARRAGCARVVARSDFVEGMARLVAEAGQARARR